MITIRFTRRSEDGGVRMVMEGHAGAGAKGADPVCAAATMLAYTLGQSVRFLYESGLLWCRPRIDLQEGRAVICAVPRREALAEVLHTFWVVQSGAWVLSRNYPRNVTLDPLDSDTPWERMRL